MRIVHLYDGHEKVYEGKGSVPDVVWSLATCTATRGHDVTVLERQWAGLPVTAVQDGVTFHRVPLRTGSAEPWAQIPYEMISSPLGALTLLIDRTNFAFATLRQLAKLGPDVIHVHLPFAANVVATVAPWLRDTMVYTAHLGETRKRVSEPIFSPDVYLAKRCARTVALNPEMRHAFAERGVSEDRLVVVPNGVDLGRFDDIDSDVREHVRDEYGPFDGSVVLFVGTVTPRKGVRELAEAATEVIPKTDGDVEFLVVGRTDMEQEYVNQVRALVSQAGIDDHVTFTGFVSEKELLALYDLGDVFVLPSFEEGSSIAVSEALAAGLPVIGSDIDGIAQQVGHGTHGLLFDPGDTSALASSITELVDDSKTRERMQEAVSARAEELSWDRVTDRIISVYEEVAE